MKMLKMPPLSQWVVFSLLLLLLSPSHFNSNQLKLAHANGLCSSKNETDMGMKLYPLIDQKKVKEMLVMNESRRKLGSYQICALCTCCGARGYCLPSPCCYAINCNIPNRPFGFCSFTPRACNCFGCHL